MTTTFAPQPVDDSDYCQVAENAWDSYAQTVKAIASARGMDVETHRSLLRVACELNDLAAGADSDIDKRLHGGFVAARSLRQHGYENDLPDREVINEAAYVQDAIDLLQTLL